MLYSTLFTIAFATAATAIKVTAPSNSTGWTSTGAQVIEWDVSLSPSSLCFHSLSEMSQRREPRNRTCSQGHHVVSRRNALGPLSSFLIYPLYYTTLSSSPHHLLMTRLSHSTSSYSQLVPLRCMTRANQSRQSAQTPPTSLSS